MSALRSCCTNGVSRQVVRERERLRHTKTAVVAPQNGNAAGEQGDPYDDAFGSRGAPKRESVEVGEVTSMGDRRG